MSTQPMIEVENLTKYYGEFPAISNVSFTVAKGEIVGFLGPNGAGKTTTMRILTSFMPPTSGTARIAGYDVVTESLHARQRIGYLPESVPLYTDMTVRGYLSFMGTIRGMDSKKIKSRIGDVIQVCHLEDYYNSLISKLSKGFRQRVGIAQAILHEPEVLVMDEPTIGIDPRQIVETRQFIKDLGQEHTLILSTHILPEVSMICQRVVIIHEGEIVAEDTPENLATRLEGTERLHMEVRGPAKAVTKALRDVPGVQDVTYIEGDDGAVGYTIIGKRGEEMRIDLAKAVIEQGWGLLSLEELTMSLEDIFLRLTTQEQE
jgi:ABC-2 type transport system ATP-binding protein